MKLGLQFSLLGLIFKATFFPKFGNVNSGYGPDLVVATLVLGLACPIPFTSTGQNAEKSI